MNKTVWKLYVSVEAEHITDAMNLLDAAIAAIHAKGGTTHAPLGAEVTAAPWMKPERWEHYA